MPMSFSAVAMRNASRPLAPRKFPAVNHIARWTPDLSSSCDEIRSNRWKSQPSVPEAL